VPVIPLSTPSHLILRSKQSLRLEGASGEHWILLRDGRFATSSG
jgi:hypothetical protein